MIVYNGSGKEILEKLKKAGYNTGRIRREKLLSEKTVQQIRSGEMVGMKTLNYLCNFMRCQPQDIILWMPDPDPDPDPDPAPTAQEMEEEAKEE